MLNAVDKFVVYDDVNFIKGGWIARNRILSNGSPSYFSIVMQGASPFKLISEINVDTGFIWKKKLLKSIELSYKKAPYFEKVYPLVQNVIEIPSDLLVDYARESVLNVKDYLGIQTQVVPSSSVYNNSSLKSHERLIDICNIEHSDHYINPIGGIEIYSKEDFLQANIKIEFIKTLDITYRQYNEPFVANLSVIDVLMFNDVAAVKDFLEKYTLL